MLHYFIPVDDLEPGGYLAGRLGLGFQNSECCGIKQAHPVIQH